MKLISFLLINELTRDFKYTGIVLYKNISGILVQDGLKCEIRREIMRRDNTRYHAWHGKIWRDCTFLGDNGDTL